MDEKTIGLFVSVVKQGAERHIEERDPEEQKEILFRYIKKIKELGLEFGKMILEKAPTDSELIFLEKNIPEIAGEVSAWKSLFEMLVGWLKQKILEAWRCQLDCKKSCPGCSGYGATHVAGDFALVYRDKLSKAICDQFGYFSFGVFQEDYFPGIPDGFDWKFQRDCPCGGYYAWSEERMDTEKVKNIARLLLKRWPKTVQQWFQLQDKKEK